MQQSLLLFEHDVFKMTSILAQVAVCPPNQRFRKKKTGTNNSSFLCSIFIWHWGPTLSVFNQIQFWFLQVKYNPYFP